MSTQYHKKIMEHLLQNLFSIPISTEFIDMSIEGMRSQKYSIGIFIFLIIAVLVFLGICAVYFFAGSDNKIKKGELFLFIWIVFGVFVAISFGAMQLLEGQLF